MADAKRRKLGELERFRRKVPHTSASALSAILREIKRSGLPDLHTRGDIAQARDVALGTRTEYGDLYCTVDLEPAEDHRGSVPKLNFIHPFAFFSVVLRVCVQFSLFLERLFDAKPPSAEHPWHILLYSDEVSPGNQLSPANNRKIQATY